MKNKTLPLLLLSVLLLMLDLSAVSVATATENSICTDGDIVIIQGTPEKMEIFFVEKEIHVNTSWTLFFYEEEVNLVSTIPTNYGILFARSVRTPIRMKFNQKEFPWTLSEAGPIGIPTGFSEKQFPWIAETVRIHPRFYFSPRELRREGVERMIMS